MFAGSKEPCLSPCMVGDINLSTKLNVLACRKAIGILYVVSAEKSTGNFNSCGNKLALVRRLFRKLCGLIG